MFSLLCGHYGMRLFALLATVAGFFAGVAAYDITKNDNVSCSVYSRLWIKHAEECSFL
jgi:hypothetical protein